MKPRRQGHARRHPCLRSPSYTGAIALLTNIRACDSTSPPQTGLHFSTSSFPARARCVLPLFHHRPRGRDKFGIGLAGRNFEEQKFCLSPLLISSQTKKIPDQKSGGNFASLLLTSKTYSCVATGQKVSYI